MTKAIIISGGILIGIGLVIIIYGRAVVNPIMSWVGLGFIAFGSWLMSFPGIVRRTR